jgi:hypothetical protein
LFNDSFSSDPDAKFFELQEFDPELFRTYVDWLYTGKLSWRHEITMGGDTHRVVPGTFHLELDGC